MVATKSAETHVSTDIEADGPIPGANSMPPAKPHTHVAVEDAREQGRLFFNIRAALKAMAARGQAKEATS